MNTLRVPLRQIAEANLVARWSSRIPRADIDFALQTGMSAPDVHLLRRFAKRYLLIVRCPNRAGMLLQGMLDPKPAGIYDKKSSADSGTVQLDDGRLVVSDYDLVSIWQGANDAWRKIPCPGPTGGGGSWGSPEADRIMTELLPKMESPFDHGCQDDFHSPKNPGVDAHQRFAAFFNETATFLGSRAALKAFYDRQGLAYPYDAAGKFTGAVK